jgi:AbrB family looped-hinge helix DNA binding protein
MDAPYKGRMSDGGRLVIPAEVRKAFGLKEGSEVVISEHEAGILIVPAQKAIERAQRYFMALAPAEVVLSEELSRDRRREAAKEADG